MNSRILLQLNNQSLEIVKKGYLRNQQYADVRLISDYQDHVASISRLIKIK